MQVSNDLLNHPLSVVAILSVILAFLGMAIREFFWFMKGLNKTTPTDRLTQTFDKLNESLEKVTQNQELLFQEMKHHSEISQLRTDQILSAVRDIRSLEN